MAALIKWHLATVGETTDAAHRFALGLEELSATDVFFFSAWEGNVLAGIGAIKDLGGGHAEVKSMRTDPEHLRKGVGAAILTSLIVTARAHGFERLSLETGTTDDFAAALSLYQRFGFTDCSAFADYPPNSPHNRYMTLQL